MRLLFDIETNGFLDALDQVFCVAAMDADTGEAYDWGPDRAEEAARFLMEADQIIGHNIIEFDIPALQKVFPWFTVERGRVFDTLVASRLIWSDLMDLDFSRERQGKSVPAKNKFGSHSLEAWGYRTGTMKDTYTEGFEAWSQTMHDYCIQDVVATKALLDLIESKNYSQEALDLEHRVAHVMHRVSTVGFPFTVSKALDLVSELSVIRAGVEDELQAIFRPWYASKGVHYPKRTITGRKPTTQGTWEGAPYTKVKLKVFNPGSNDDIADRLKRLRGWRPTIFTPTGKPKVDEDVLKHLPYPEAEALLRYQTVQKRLGQIAEGKKAWLKFEKNGRIHGRYNTNGAVTGRATHMDPNLGQVPSEKKEWGPECRACFHAGEGRVLVGVDLSGIELRCLAHFMSRYDDGAYAKVLLEGDIHTANQEAAGLPTRDMAKTFIYGFLYGAGNAKIGLIVNKGPKAGADLKKRFLAGLPALDKVQKAISKKVKATGKLKGLDGRILKVRHAHAALNTLLQSAGALIAKRWIVEFEDRWLALGAPEGAIEIVAWVHDELQISCLPEYGEKVKELAIEAALAAGKHFNFRLPTDATGDIGQTWADTH